MKGIEVWIMNEVFNNIVTFLGTHYEECETFYSVVRIILSVFVLHKVFYIIIGLFFTREFKPTKNKHKYAILIPARNEENVIGNLIDSINKQDYPQDMITIFVVADNCTDNTAAIARKKSAKCYERFDETHKTKGYALQYLFKCIEKDYGIDSFEGYFIFDSDNLLSTDYISRMNEAFDEGLKIITSYRNTKNFDENWISSTYAIHWLRSVRFEHRARSILHLATNIQGTGFLFSNEIVRNGWNYTSITEDRALTVDAVSQGYEISYNDKAVFYDEQPTSLKIALRQRIRWSKGHLLAFKDTGFKLFINIIFGKTFVKNKWYKEKKEENLFKRIKESIRHRFASFDTFSQLLPSALVSGIAWLIIMLCIYMCFCYINGITNISLFKGSTIFNNLFYFMFSDVKVGAQVGIEALKMSFLLVIFWRVIYYIEMYLESIIVAIYIFVVERRRIPKISIWKKILYCFTWPTFDIIGIFTLYIALFKKVSWKPIPHTSKVTIYDIKH